MTQAELATRQERARTETFVIRETDEGFRIYTPSRPDLRYVVSGDPDTANCTCPDFEHHAHDPEWRCKHILAVFDAPDDRNGHDTNGEPLPRSGPASHSGGEHTAANRMVLKRSVSPDGRIDSLSVEFAVPVDPRAPAAGKAAAARIIGLQSEIVSGFLNGSRGSNATQPQRPPAHRRAVGQPSERIRRPVEAELVSIGGLDTRYGRRLYVNIRCDGKMLKLFGGKTRLAEAIEAAGFPEAAEYVEEGIQLNLPCRITTKQSEDGRYINVDAVYPYGNEEARQ